MENMESKERIAYKVKWDRDNTKQFKIKLMKTTDSDIISWLEEQDNKQGYIKQLIRDDIARKTGSRINVTVSKPDTEISDEFTEPE